MEKYAQLLFIKRIWQIQKFDNPYYNHHEHLSATMSKISFKKNWNLFFYLEKMKNMFLLLKIAKKISKISFAQIGFSSKYF
jgi:hypothetical protein